MARCMPRWATPSRQAELVKLWLAYGNKCLLGHSVCPHIEHYVYAEYKGVMYATERLLACHDSQGNPIKADGKQLYITGYQVKTGHIVNKKLLGMYDLKETEAIKAWIAEDRARTTAD
jgi:hypothetical protein